MDHYGKLCADWAEGCRPDFLFFWGRKRGDSREVGPFAFSQWHKSPFEVGGVVYHTAEHWMMAEKARLFEDPKAEAKILKYLQPRDAQNMGREIRNFNQEVWDAHKFEIVRQGSIHKFEQNDLLRGYLLGTGDRVLVESSPVDEVWGIGLKDSDPKARDPLTWKGTNLLGFALTEARAFFNLS